MAIDAMENSGQRSPFTLPHSFSCTQSVPFVVNVSCLINFRKFPLPLVKKTKRYRRFRDDEYYKIGWGMIFRFLIYNSIVWFSKKKVTFPLILPDFISALAIRLPSTK